MRKSRSPRNGVVVGSVASTSGDLDQQAIDWLLTSDEPGIRLQTRRDLVGERLAIDGDEVLRGALVSRLLDGQRKDGSFGIHPYQKWTGAHWRLVSLVELGIPAGEPHSVAAAETVIDWLTSEGDPRDARSVRGTYRVHASQEGNALAVCTRLGLAGDERVRGLAHALLLWQWPDGGWNCDPRPFVTHSSFYESITPLWGLAEYAQETGDQDMRRAAERTAEFFLQHRVFRSHASDTGGDAKWLRLRYPEYWHYDYLHGLVMLARAGALPDTRADEAVVLLREQQQPDGRWIPSGAQYWRGATGLYGDAARWYRSLASEMLTLNGLRVLRAVGA